MIAKLRCLSKKAVYKMLSAFFILAFSFSFTVYAAPSPPEIDATSAILIESGRGQVLFAKHEKARLHVSTMCKMMTTLLAIEMAKLDQEVTISKESSGTGGATLHLEAGEKYTVEDLLYAVMLESANDAANALAEHVGGNIGKFVEIMNNKARELNLKDTHFKNPTGLFDKDQYTTASDIARLMKYSLGNQTFNKFFSCKATPWDKDGRRQILLNKNRLFWNYDGVDGGKVGYYDEDKYSVITSATRSNLRLVSIVLDSPVDNAFNDSTKMLDYGFINFRTGVLVYKGQKLTESTIEGKKVGLVSSSDEYYTFPTGESYIKDISFDIMKNPAPPITKDKIIGVARYTLSDDSQIDVTLYPDTEILPPENKIQKAVDNLKQNKGLTVLLIVLSAAEVLLAVYYSARFVGRKIFKRLKY